MAVIGCSNDGDMNDAKFSEPLPWIGLYIAAASLVCLIAMAADVIHGFCHRKFWFPCKFFGLNSTSLTLIAVAIKLSVDLNTSMPSKEDQLAKLSSAALMCTIMGNSMPSLGGMENTEILMNIMALGILVITLMVNICIQLGTGVIYVFLKEHVFIIFLMLVLLALLSFSALTLPTTKSYLEMKYSVRHNLALRETSNETARKSAVEKLRENMMKYWMMALTCSPQFVMGRSVTCTASGAICLLNSAILAEAILTSYLMQRSFKFCSGQSDYKWSISLILVIQCVAVGIGTIGPAFRWFAAGAINLRSPKLGKTGYKKEFKLEKYWIQRLIEMKDCPLTFRIENRRRRKLAHAVKNKVLDICIALQTVIVFTSKMIRLVSIVLFIGIFWLYSCFKRLKNKLSFRGTVSVNNSGSEEDPDRNQDMSRFVLHLEGEDDLVQQIVANNSQTTNQWIQMGKKKKPKHLKYLLEGTIISRGFKGVAEFDSHHVPCLDCEEPPNCWALPVVTLTSIAIALPNTNRCLIKQLVKAVNEGLPYIRLIEDHLDREGNLANLRKAADVVWLGIDLHRKWLDIDLPKISHTSQHSKSVLEQLSECAKKIYAAEKKVNFKLCSKLGPSKWTVKILATNSMYRISQSILLNDQTKSEQMYDGTFAAIAGMISAIMGACFTNLQSVIGAKCSSSGIEERAKRVIESAYTLGETEAILRLLEKAKIPGLDPDQMARIDEWRLAYKLDV